MRNSKFKVIGTNAATKYLDDKVLSFSYFNFTAKHQPVQADIDGKSYLLDIKSIAFDGDGVFVAGFMSDEKKNVGRISLKYLPNRD